MSRAAYETDSDADFEAAAAEYEGAADYTAQAQPGHDPFGPVLGFQQPAAHAYQGFENAPAPVFASPSLVPSADFTAGAYDLDDEELPSGGKKSKWMVAGSVLALVLGLSGVGVYFAQESRAEEQRMAEIEQIKQRMAEIEAKHRAEEATRPTEVAPATGSTVAAMLAAGTQNAHAERPRNVNDARQAAAIKRALSAPAPTRRGKVARKGRGAGRRQAAPSEDTGLQENRSNDPIYGL